MDLELYASQVFANAFEQELNELLIQDCCYIQLATISHTV